MLGYLDGLGATKRWVQVPKNCLFHVLIVLQKGSGRRGQEADAGPCFDTGRRPGVRRRFAGGGGEKAPKYD